MCSHMARIDSNFSACPVDDDKWLTISYLAITSNPLVYCSFSSMMNYVEEQKNELEAISEIYYNEIYVRSSQPPISFSIKVRPQASGYQAQELDDDDDEDEDEEDGSDIEDIAARDQSPSVELLFELPVKYPDTKPSIQVLSSQNLEEDEVLELTENLNIKCEEFIGTVMILMLVSDVVEWLSSKADRESSKLNKEQEEKKQELEAEERRKCDGESVTLETFMAWKAKFDAELLKIKLEQQKRLAEQNPTGQRRLTGREMFEKDKALVESDLDFVEGLGQEQLEALMQNVDELELEDDDEEFEPDDEELSSEELSD